MASEREKAERSLAQKKEELERVSQAIREQAEGENGIRRGWDSFFVFTLSFEKKKYSVEQKFGNAVLFKIIDFFV